MRQESGTTQGLVKECLIDEFNWRRHVEYGIYDAVDALGHTDVHNDNVVGGPMPSFFRSSSWWMPIINVHETAIQLG